jgi:CII-binding regulator of phage lambda lysogenization HflD
VDDAQTWTLIGGFFALNVTMIGLTLRAVRAEISVLGVRIDGVDRRLDHLDRDVQTVVSRLMDS